MSYLRILICSFFILSGLCSYGQNAQRSDTITMLCQNWKIKELYRHQFKSDEIQELNDYIKTTQVHFNRDGSFLSNSDTTYIKGKWQLIGKLIIVQMEEGDSFKMKIIALSATSFNFESGPADSETIVTAGILVPVKGIIAPIPAN
jgi:hypothetical protein